MHVRKMAGMAVAAILLAAGGTAVAVNIETVHVGNPGNTADTQVMSDGTTGYGAVAYGYNIGKYEVTTGQYVAFLNAVAAIEDTNNLWVDWSDITRSGGEGAYSYSISPARVNHPVNNVTFKSAVRFANWLHNGQPVGFQNFATTEDGAYDLSGGDFMLIGRESDWKWAIASEHEWYKAAYYNPATDSYYDYATSSDIAPTKEIPPGGTNSANYDRIINDTCAVGSYTLTKSPYGTFDQTGNVLEWTEGINLAGDKRIHRGAAYMAPVHRLVSSDRNFQDPPTSTYVTLGFRVVEVPEPASMAILALGGIGILLRRRKLGR